MPRGKICRFLQSAGSAVAFVSGLDVPGSYAFGFERIVGYRGESLRELGLHIGTEVTFELTGDRVDAVRLIKGT